MNIRYIYAKIMKKLRGSCITRSNIHPTATVYSGSDVVDSNIGRYTYVGYDCHIDKTTIGAFCSLSDHIFIGGAEHPIDWVTTSPMFQNVGGSGTDKRFARHDAPLFSHTTIGNDVWIGHGVTIKTGITVGDGAVIGSGSVVTKDVPPYSVVAGVPARVLRYRFDDNTIDALQKLRWWEWDDEKLTECGKYITNPTEFIRHFA